jgi:hypothetical protein
VESIAKRVWDLLTNPLPDTGTSMNVALCSLVSKFWNRSSSEGDPDASDTRSLFHSIGFDLQKGFSDGILCCHGTLSDENAEERFMELWRRSKTVTANIPRRNGELLGVEKCLELIALCASPVNKSTSVWFPVLCRIMLPSKDQATKSDKLRLLAKRCLRQLCGNDSALSHAVRDHFVFAFHCQKLLGCTNDVLQYSVLLNEKARQSGSAWKTSGLSSFHSLSLGQLVGTNGLVSEDVCKLQMNEIAGKTLAELLAVASKRSCSWRRFCSLSAFPSGGSCSADAPLEFMAAPPLRALFAVACTTSTENQAVALRLINLALVRLSDRKPQAAKAPEGNARPKYSDDEKDLDATDSITSKLSSFYPVDTTPEEVLNVSINDVCSFALRFVCRGTTADIRHLACCVVKRLCHRFDKPSLAILFDRLMGGPLCQSGQSGKRSAELVTLLQALLVIAGAETIDVRRYSRLLQSYLKQQILAIRHDRANSEFMHLETMSGTLIQKKRYDLAACASCRFLECRTKDGRTDRTTPSSGAERGSSLTVRTSGTSTPLDPAKVRCYPNKLLHFRDSGWTPVEILVPATSSAHSSP